MSSDPFAHKDSKISLAQRCALAILEKLEDGKILADSTRDGATKLVDHLDNPGKLARSRERRVDKLHSGIGVGITNGFIEFSGENCLLRITSHGKRALKDHREKMQNRQNNKMRKRRHGRQTAMG